jgi:hypothetical protein
MKMVVPHDENPRETISFEGLPLYYIFMYNNMLWIKVSKTKNVPLWYYDLGGK